MAILDNSKEVSPTEIALAAAEAGLQKAAERYSQAKVEHELSLAEAEPLSKDDLDSILEAVRGHDLKRLIEEVLSRVNSLEKRFDRANAVYGHAAEFLKEHGE